MDGMIKQSVSNESLNSSGSIDLERSTWTSSLSYNKENQKLNFEIQCIPEEGPESTFKPNKNWNFCADVTLRGYADGKILFTLDLPKTHFTSEKKTHSSLVENVKLNSSITCSVIIIITSVSGLSRSRPLDYTKLEDMIGSDLAIKCKDGVTAFLHRAVANENSGYFNETCLQFNVINSDYNYKDMFKLLLDCWYSDDFEINEANVLLLNELSKYYQDIKLLNLCHEYCLNYSGTKLSSMEKIKVLLLENDDAVSVKIYSTHLIKIAEVRAYLEKFKDSEEFDRLEDKKKLVIYECMYKK